MKETFVLNAKILEQVNKLSDEQAGVLFKSILSYQMEEEIPEMDLVTEILFSIVRQTIDDNNEKYAEICKQRAIAGAKGRATQKAKREAKVANATAKVASADFATAKVADNDSDNDCEYDCDYEGDIKRDKPPAFIPPTLDQIKRFITDNGYSVNAERFYSYYTTRNWLVGKNKVKMTDWKQKVTDWNSDEKNKPGNISRINFSQRSDPYSVEELKKTLLTSGG